MDLETHSRLADFSNDYVLLGYIIDYSIYHLSDGNKHDLILTRFLLYGFLTFQSPPSDEILISFSSSNHQCAQGKPCSQCAYLFHSSRKLMSMSSRLLLNDLTLVSPPIESLPFWLLETLENPIVYTSIPAENFPTNPSGVQYVVRLRALQEENLNSPYGLREWSAMVLDPIDLEKAWLNSHMSYWTTQNEEEALLVKRVDQTFQVKRLTRHITSTLVMDILYSNY